MNKKQKKELKNQIIDIFKGQRNLLTFGMNVLGALLISFAFAKWSEGRITPGTAIIIGIVLIVIASYFLHPFRDKEK